MAFWDPPRKRKSLVRRSGSFQRICAMMAFGGLERGRILRCVKGNNGLRSCRTSPCHRLRASPSKRAIASQIQVRPAGCWLIWGWRHGWSYAYDAVNPCCRIWPVSSPIGPSTGTGSSVDKARPTATGKTVLRNRFSIWVAGVGVGLALAVAQPIGFGASSR
jgi:hypothetical protein